MADSDDGSFSQRHSHYNHQRSSLRSERSIRTPPSRSSRPQSPNHVHIHDFVLREDPDNNLDRFEPFDPIEPVESIEPYDSPSPAPVIPRRKGSLDGTGKRQSARSNPSRRGSTRTYGSRSGSRGTVNIDEYLAPTSSHGYGNRNRTPTSPTSPGNRYGRTFYRHSTLEEERTESPASRRPQPSHKSSPPRRSPRRSPLRLSRRGTPATELSITALPIIPALSSGGGRASRFATGLYTFSYLVFFSILGTLARLGLQWLTFYPGAPVVFSNLWANVAGTFIMGFLGEDRRLFRQEWGLTPPDQTAGNTTMSDEEKALQDSAAAAVHGKVKKTIPLYIGLATGFCGSFTSFSSFMRDIFFALANELPSPINHPSAQSSPTTSTGSTLPRNPGYSVMAVLAVIVTTLGLCYGAIILGSHAATYTSRIIPTLPYRLTRRLLDPLFVLLGLGCWIGAIILCIFPPDRPNGPASTSSSWQETSKWRGQVLFAIAFAPAGCLIRFYISAALNSLIPSFPLGTFAVNVFGTAVLGMAFDLQHVRIAGPAGGLAGGGQLGCQVLQGVMDGFCGALTTVSTWIAEIKSLRRGHAYAYTVSSVVTGTIVVVVVMGSVRWTVGWVPVSCVV